MKKLPKFFVINLGMLEIYKIKQVPFSNIISVIGDLYSHINSRLGKDNTKIRILIRK